MLVSGNDLLTVANMHGFAVPAFNVADYNMFKGLIEIGEARDSPLFLAIHPNEITQLGFDVLHAIRSRIHRSPVPVAIHFDHGLTFAQVIAAIHGGCTSVMIDASAKPFGENVELTRRVADAAAPLGISVEGELGTIGTMELHADGDDIIYTNPDDAVTFVRETGVDSLAVAIGTRHGIYPSSIIPELRIGLLKEIKAAVDIPLVLHGGSNNPDEQIAEAARSGINKVNISADIKVAYFDEMRRVLQDPRLREPDAIQPRPLAAMKVVASHKIDLLGSAHRGGLYGPPPFVDVDLFGDGRTETV